MKRKKRSRSGQRRGERINKLVSVIIDASKIYFKGQSGPSLSQAYAIRYLYNGLLKKTIDMLVNSSFHILTIYLGFMGNWQK